MLTSPDLEVETASSRQALQLPTQEPSHFRTAALLVSGQKFLEFISIFSLLQTQFFEESRMVPQRGIQLLSRYPIPSRHFGSDDSLHVQLCRACTAQQQEIRMNQGVRVTTRGRSGTWSRLPPSATALPGFPPWLAINHHHPIVSP